MKRELPLVIGRMADFTICKIGDQEDPRQDSNLQRVVSGGLLETDCRCDERMCVRNVVERDVEVRRKAEP